MRLLVVTQYFWPENFRINELVTELSCRGHEITVLTGWPNYPEGRVFDVYRQNPSQYGCFVGTRVVRVPLLTRGRGGLRLILNYVSFAASASVLGAWKLRGQKFDAVLVYEPSPITVGIPGAVMRFFKRAPMALWVLDLWPDTLKAVGVVKSGRLLNAVGHLVSWIYRRCDLILAQSRSFEDQIALYAPKSINIKYFPAWADEVFQQGRIIEPNTAIPSAPGVFTVLFAGNIGEAQDFPSILDAAERLGKREDIRWIVVGDGRMLNWVSDQIKRRNLTDKVLLVGRHPLERMPAFFAHADALLVSLKDEPIFTMTIPGKMQAYLGSGIPVLAMLNGEGADIVLEAEAGLVSPAGDGAALAQNVIKLASMGEMDRVRLGENGRRFCVNQFDRSTLISSLESWLQEMIARKHGLTETL
ncbi:MAG: glycosyltransferase family 4 protein [Sedimenticola thiotaurini]|uniref:Glycosyltransferase family 4 protein n=1 Tax=Sedimenticola thiotaurini TaxID=1543721 RepID=A0A558DAP0_9GAMM|nr:MAG: glycosyltransferase family 4 protein [Sedimenticola thiotaurini]